MGLAEEVARSSRAVSGAAFSIAHVLGVHVAQSGSPDGIDGARAGREEAERYVAVRQEMEALCISVRAVMDEAKPVIDLLHENARVVRGGEAGARVRNGFGSLCAILVTLLDHTAVACLDVSAARGRVLPGGHGVFERLRTHHGQLRAMYGIMHLASKIVALADVENTLFINVPYATTAANAAAAAAATPTRAVSQSDPQFVTVPSVASASTSSLPPLPSNILINNQMDPHKWRAAIKMDDFYGRWFGFHYTPHMRNVLRIVNIARGSVDQAVADNSKSSSLVKNVSMLGWGWFYTNIMLINNLGVNIDAASKIGADTGAHPTVESVRTFMNLVEDPLIAGVTNLASADSAIDRAFEIPQPPDFADASALRRALLNYDTVPVTVDYEHILTAFRSITAPVTARLMSFKKRPFSVDALLAPGESPSQHLPNPPQSTADLLHFIDADVAPTLHSQSVGQVILSSDNSSGARRASQADGSHSASGANMTNGHNGARSSSATTASTKANRSPIVDTIAGVAESSYLASALKTEFTKLQSNVSSLLGLTQAEPAKGLILHFHGGGFVSQSSLGHSVYIKEWCSDMSDAVVLSIDYKLAPENRYPIALHECVYAYIWALQNAAALGTRAERVVIVGDSAGGNLALATALYLSDARLRTPDGVFLAYPSLYLSKAWSPSHLLSFFDPLLPLSVMELCMASYLDEEQQCRATTDPYISPVVASAEQLRDLPPVVAIAGSIDPLLDDTALLAHRLRECGRHNDVIRIYDAMPHGFLNMIQVSEEARNATAFLARHMASCLDIGFRREAAPGPATSTDNHADRTEVSGSPVARASRSTPALHL